MLKYTFLNTALFRGTTGIPMYMVFDTETKEVYYLAQLSGKSIRGQKFSDKSRSKVARWRQAFAN